MAHWDRLIILEDYYIQCTQCIGHLFGHLFGITVYILFGLHAHMH